MSEGSSDDTEPQTPLKYPQVQEDDGDHTPSFSSPPASPSLSLHSPVRSPFSPLRHEISLHDDRASDSSLPDRHELVHDPSGVMDDSRDALIQRLNDLAARLSAGEEAYGENVSIIHSKVDELERMLAPSLVYEPRRHKRSRSPLSMDSNESDWEYGQQGPSYHKLHVLKADVPRVELKDAEIQAEPQLVPTYPNRQERKRDNSGNAKHVLAEAQKVQEALGIVVSNLRARQEEQEVGTTLSIPVP